MTEPSCHPGPQSKPKRRYHWGMGESSLGNTPLKATILNTVVGPAEFRGVMGSLLLGSDMVVFCPV